MRRNDAISRFGWLSSSSSRARSFRLHRLRQGRWAERRGHSQKIARIDRHGGARHQWPGCAHSRSKGAGASREESLKRRLQAAALRAGAAVTHGALAVKLFDSAAAVKIPNTRAPLGRSAAGRSGASPTENPAGTATVQKWTALAPGSTQPGQRSVHIDKCWQAVR